MQLLQWVTGNLEENAYAAFAEGGAECVLVDPGADPGRIAADLEAKGLKPAAVLLTHGHRDHTGGAAYFQARGAKVYIHEADAKMLSSPARSLAFLLGERQENILPDVLLSGGETLLLAGLEFTVIATPGHSPGSVCYLCGDSLFSGDTLFCRGVGRTDFPGGDGKSLVASLRRLYALNASPAVYPGHGEPTTLDGERAHNPYVSEKRP